MDLLESKLNLGLDVELDLEALDKTKAHVRKRL